MVVPMRDRVGRLGGIKSVTDYQTDWPSRLSGEGSKREREGKDNNGKRRQQQRKTE